jgi:hypothetical protein
VSPDSVNTHEMSAKLNCPSQLTTPCVRPTLLISSCSHRRNRCLFSCLSRMRSGPVSLGLQELKLSAVDRWQGGTG